MATAARAAPSPSPTAGAHAHICVSLRVSPGYGGHVSGAAQQVLKDELSAELGSSVTLEEKVGRLQVPA